MWPGKWGVKLVLHCWFYEYWHLFRRKSGWIQTIVSHCSYRCKSFPISIFVVQLSQVWLDGSMKFMDFRWLLHPWIEHYSLNCDLHPLLTFLTYNLFEVRIFSYEQVGGRKPLRKFHICLEIGNWFIPSCTNCIQYHVVKDLVS